MLTNFNGNEAKSSFFRKNVFKLAVLPILKNVWQTFYGLVLRLVGLIDAKGIDVAQPTVRAPL